MVAFVIKSDENPVMVEEDSISVIGGGVFSGVPTSGRWVTIPKSDARTLPVFGGVATVPVGGGVFPILVTGSGVFSTPPAAIADPSAIPLPPIDRRDTTPDQGAIPMEDSWGAYMGAGNVLPDDWNAYPTPSQHPAIGGATPPIAGDDDVSIFDDLGDVLGDVYTGVDRAVGGWLPGGVPLGSVPITGGVPAFVGDVGIPATTGAPVAAPVQTTAVMPAQRHVCYQYDSMTGTWKMVQKRKRRRKRLATQTDIKDLAALAGVVGKGKIMETWIATHS